MNTKPKLTLVDLAEGLERFGPRYNAIDVFADDVDEVRSRKLPADARPIPGRSGGFEVRVNDRPYFLRVFENAGVVRLARAPEPHGTDSSNSAMFGALAGAAIGAATSKKGEGVVGGMLLGLLVGAALGSSTEPEPAPHKVFTLRFDPLAREWKTYSGGLVRWMKSELARPIAVPAV